MKFEYPFRFIYMDMYIRTKFRTSVLQTTYRVPTSSCLNLEDNSFNMIYGINFPDT